MDYEREIKPLLRDHCYACHGVFKQQGNLRLDSAASALKGGDTGPAIERGNDQSLILQVVTGAAGFRMPPEGEGQPLTEAEIARLRQWIKDGAPAPEQEEVLADPQQHWSYRPPQRPALPTVKHPAGIGTAVDAFLAARHEELGLTPQPPAEPQVWLRRAYLDLIGLPPTPAELQAFLQDPSPEARARVVDDLLSRPQYGERWGRHWMDVWRYSDWYGSRNINEIRYSQRHIWRWRDWIVESLNEDLGYDQMIVAMLAGDEIAAGDPDVLRATGFLGRNWYKFDRNVWMFETVEQSAQAFLAVTMRCCRCHDHKFEPITQLEYYRYRAFFEPHDVRTDQLQVGTETEKDATLGQVLKDGVARVYDKQLDVPTYVFERGDDRYPDQEHPLVPGVPAILGGDPLDVATVQLAPQEFYPALRDAISRGLVEQAVQRVEECRQAIEAARATADDARQQRDQLAARVAAGETTGNEATTPFLSDDFETKREDVWKVINGDWSFENGHLIQKNVGSFLTITTQANHPRDFRARIVYRTLEPGTYRSVGCSFDYVDQGASQDVYTSTGDASQSVQAFHREGGKQVYPPAGIVKTSLKVGDVTTLELEVRGSQLSITLNGEKKLDYALPVPRREGKFALWVHAGAAEFHDIEIVGLAPTLADFERKFVEASQAVGMAELRQKTAEAEVEAWRARVAAERAKYLQDVPPGSDVATLAQEACRAERQVDLAKADEQVLLAEQQLSAFAPATAESATAESATAESAAGQEPQLAAARQKLTEALAAREAAIQKLNSPDGTYAPLGEIFPATSTGRRLALARWIASPSNPRTARVAVNQIWMRHFGQALVPTVANFGLGGERPSHPELLDWLAVELMEHGWSMKHMHRLIVLSHAYARSSTSTGAAAADNRKLDPDNRYLWRMNSRRMEAEVVRDSLLSIAGTLDTSRGGPEIPEAQGQTNLRRSLYFRNTPNEKMQLLEVFDMANPNECYRRRDSVVPHQALALMNSGLALDQARTLAETLTQECGENEAQFVESAFERVLNRSATAAEQQACQRFLRDHARLLQDPASTAFAAGGQSRRPPSSDLGQRAREDLVHVLFSHNDFVTIR